jgi:hypothetical protein
VGQTGKPIGTVGARRNRGGGGCDQLVRVPSTDTVRLWEAQILIGPVICAAAEQTLFAAGRADFPVCRPQRRAKKSATGDVALKITTKGGWRRTDPRDQHVRII